MIKAERGRVETQGNIAEIMADYSTIKTCMEEIFVENGYDPEKAFADIETSRGFANLKKAGMSDKDAVDVIFSTKSDEERKEIISKFKMMGDILDESN